MLSLIGLFLLPLIMDMQTVQAAGAGFTVSANIPDNQYNEALSSFDLVMKPNQTETLSVVIENLEDNTKTISAAANTGIQLIQEQRPLISITLGNYHRRNINLVSFLINHK